MTRRRPRSAPARLPAVAALALGLLAAPAALADNVHLIESLPNGFAIYRSGEPGSREEVAELCRLGIREMAVLAGSAEKNELRHRNACPKLKIIYDERQDANKPLDTEFLAWFDRWVEEARKDGKKIAFRCSCGCHRTGRLAAYYQMKYQNVSLEDALAVMYARGKNWERHRNIEPQVRALKDYLDGKPCSQKPEYCVREGGKRHGS